MGIQHGPFPKARAVSQMRIGLPRRNCRKWRASSTSCQSPQTPFIVSLERSIGARQGADKVLSTEGSFNHEVYPDLPIDTDWRGFFGKLLYRRHTERDQDGPSKTSERQLIRTIGCQVRSKETLIRKLLQASQDNADGVLLLSGSHPAHKFASCLGRTPSSIELLKEAQQMKREEKLRDTLALWAVENPMCNPASRLASKLDAGAEIVLTQPPLLWEAFAGWWEDIQRMGLTDQGLVVVGIPMVTSLSNLQFWLQLCNVSSKPEAASLVQNFKAEAEREGFASFMKDYNRHLISKVLRLPGVRGVHVMPLTKSARQQVLDLQSEGVLPRSSIHT